VHHDLLWSVVCRILKGKRSAPKYEPPAWDDGNFKAGGIHTQDKFWREVLTSEHKQKAEVMEWIDNGVDIHKFLITDKSTGGPVQVPKLRGANRVTEECVEFVSEQIAKDIKSGALIEWAGTEEPQVIIPLTCDRTRSKWRLIHDTRELNKFIRSMPFTMEALDTIPALVSAGGYQTSLDHASGFKHVNLAVNSRTYFCIQWQGVVYTSTVLVFGFCASPYVYQTLSNILRDFFRNREILTMTFMDDIWIGGWQRRPAWSGCNDATWVIRAAHYLAGYYLSSAKNVTVPTQLLQYLGLLVDSRLGAFWVGEDKRTKFIELIKGVLLLESCSTNLMERIAGKAMSMQLAVPGTKTYCRRLFKFIAGRKTKARGNIVTPQRRRRHAAEKQAQHAYVAVNGELREELQGWISVQRFLNGGGKWLNTFHTKLTIFSDASTKGYGGIVLWPDGSTTEVADCFVEDEFTHINTKEVRALQYVLEAVLRVKGRHALSGCRIDAMIDSQAAIGAINKGGVTHSTLMTDAVRDLTELIIKSNCALASTQWLASKDNAIADARSREGSWRLTDETFAAVWQWAGGISGEWMATERDVHKDKNGTPLPYVSRYPGRKQVAVNVLAQDMSDPIWTHSRGIPYCFPPVPMQLAVVKHAMLCKARVVMILPMDTSATWWPLLVGSIQRHTVLPTNMCEGTGAHHKLVWKPQAGMVWAAIELIF
jgi:hypothetical protein